MSSSAEDRPPPRDPILEDPEFAELVDPPPKPPAAPVEAEPVDVPVESLPVAAVIRPKAVPVPPPAPPSRPKVNLPTPVETEPPRPQWMMACGVIGCLGVFVIAAIAALVWIVVTLMSSVGDKFSDTQPTSRSGATAADKVPRGAAAPMALAADTELALPGRVDAVGRGGGGRFLLMRCSTKNEIAVFDVNQAKIAYTIPTKQTGALFAAGADKIFVYESLEKNIHRYGLFSGELEATQKLADPPLVRALAIGGSTSGPLRAVSASKGSMRITAIDAGTLQAGKSDDFSFKLPAQTPVLARTSENGSVLGISTESGAVAVWYGTGNPTSRLLGTRSPKPAWVMPSPDGQFLYSSRGVFDSGGHPYVGTNGGMYSFPPATGAEWYLSMDDSDDEVGGSPLLRRAGVANTAKSTPLEKIFFLRESGPANAVTADLIAADRIHYWPEAGFAAVLPRTEANAEAKLQLFKLPVAGK